jgi:50S ribosomal subunit-associated GTPase HflX
VPIEQVGEIVEKLNDKALKLVSISALHRTNLEQLKQEVVATLSNYVRISFTVPTTKETMPFISWVFKNTDVKTINYIGDSAHVVFEASPWLAEKVRSRVEVLNGKFEKVTSDVNA